MRAAKDLETGTLYLYAEYYRGQAEPAVQIEAIKGFGDWIPGVIDPAANAKGQKDGVELLEVYLDAGLDLSMAVNALEAGILKVYRMMTQGKLKVFETCQHWLEEYRLYRRDENGKVIKEADHLMDATRYLIMSGIDEMKAGPGDALKTEQDELPWPWTRNYGPGGGGDWMGE